MKNIFFTIIAVVSLASCSLIHANKDDNSLGFCEALNDSTTTITNLHIDQNPKSTRLCGKAAVDGEVEMDFVFIVAENGKVYLMTLVDSEIGAHLVDGMYEVKDKNTIDLVHEMIALEQE